MGVCIALSAGWAVALFTFIVFVLLVVAEVRWSRGFAALGLFAVGLGSCAIEDRFCEFAERQAAHR